jgi:hypothetical protein
MSNLYNVVNSKGQIVLPATTKDKCEFFVEYNAAREGCKIVEVS